MTEPAHECTSPDPGEGATVVSYTCGCGRTWLLDRETGEWKLIEQD